MTENVSSRYKTFTDQSDKIAQLIEQKSTLELQVKEAESNLALRVKNAEVDKKNIKQKAIEEQIEMASANKKTYDNALIVAAKTVTLKTREIEDEKAEMNENYNNSTKHAKDYYEINKIKIDKWVEDSEKRQESVIRQIELETLKVKNLKDSLQVKIKTIQLQIELQEKTMDKLAIISQQAPSSTK
jgi:hypothetical protein